jgi:hypothetical protein
MAERERFVFTQRLALRADPLRADGYRLILDRKRTTGLSDGQALRPAQERRDEHVDVEDDPSYRRRRGFVLYGQLTRP